MASIAKSNKIGAYGKAGNGNGNGDGKLKGKLLHVVCYCYRLLAHSQGRV